MENTLDTIGKRLRFARAFAGLGPNEALEAVRAVRAKEGKAGPSRRTFYALESDTRRLVEEDAADYATAYGVKPELLVRGAGLAGLVKARDAEKRARAVAALEQVERIAKRRNGRAAKTQKVKINQETSGLAAPSSQQPIIRNIAVLSTGDLKNLENWSGGLATEPAMTMDVASAFAGNAGFIWEIPAGDLAMVAKEGFSAHPGTPLLVDPDAEIKPGSYVLAELPGHDHLLFRIYRATRNYAAGVAFTLAALNGDYEPIKVRAQKKRLKIAAVTGMLFVPLAS